MPTTRLNGEEVKEGAAKHVSLTVYVRTLC
jgi:hypothetical protein